MTPFPLFLALVAGQGAAPGPDVKPLARFLDDQTVAVLHLDLATLDVAGFFRTLGAAAKRDVRGLTGDAKKLAHLVNELTDAGVQDVYAVWSLRDTPDHDAFLVVPPGKGFREPAALEALNRWEKNDFERIGGALVGGSKAIRDRLRALKPTPRPDVEKALTGAGQAAARLALVPTRDTAKVLAEVMPTLPKEFGGGSVEPLTKLRWATLTLEGPAKIAVRLTVQAPDNATAKELETFLGQVVAGLRKDKLVRAALPDLEKLLALWKPAVRGDQLVLELDEKTLGPVLEPYLARVMPALERDQASRRLGQVILGMHNYEATYGTFPPPANYDKAGKPLLSWRVHLLPYLNEAALYKQFRLDEPWDSPHNKKLLARMPAVYLPVDAKLAAQFKTTVLAPLGEETMFPGRRGLRITDVTDGTVNTIFLVEAADDRAVPWTKPEDLPYDAKKPRQGLAVRDDRYLLGLVDGSVRLVKKGVTDQVLHALFTRSGGEVIDDE